MKNASLCNHQCWVDQPDPAGMARKLTLILSDTINAIHQTVPDDTTHWIWPFPIAGSEASDQRKNSAKNDKASFCSVIMQISSSQVLLQKNSLLCTCCSWIPLSLSWTIFMWCASFHFPDSASYISRSLGRYPWWHTFPIVQAGKDGIFRVEWPSGIWGQSNSVVQNAQEIKRTLFNRTKRDKTCKFSRTASFSS